MLTNESTVTLKCNMEKSCASPVTHIDAKGWVFCTPHGEARKVHRNCRKLRPHELRKLQRGEPIARY